jgi:hypothetical protein
MAGVVFFDPYYSALLDADLKREAWHLVAEVRGCRRVLHLRSMPSL